MLPLYIIILISVVALAVFYICKEYVKKPKDQVLAVGVVKNKKQIQNMVANVESIIVYANGNELLCNRLVELKENIKFFNPTSNSKVTALDLKISNKLDDLKILVAKDNTQETCLRVLEEVEAFVVQRKKEEINA